MTTPTDRRAVTGTMLRDLVVCERRAWLDVHGDQDARGVVSAFVRMLWAGGMAHEAEVLAGLGGEVADLRDVAPAGREAATAAAMAGAADHILGGALRHGDLVGRPDVLSRAGGTWFAGDAKAGSANMPDGRRPRLEYAV